ncbi:MAG: hypothetical protein L0215_14575 [Gemmataceae bacterium]|nr:hypothetical protein [Gemmataceae bacterium]
MNTTTRDALKKVATILQEAGWDAQGSTADQTLTGDHTIRPQNEGHDFGTIEITPTPDQVNMVFHDSANGSRRKSIVLHGEAAQHLLQILHQILKTSSSS